VQAQIATEPGEAIVEIEGRRFAYSIDQRGRIVAKVAGGTYTFRQWTWGEKNRATAAAAQEDANSGQLRFDLALFNEMMLASCLEAADGLTEISLATLRALPANLGDQLLLLAYWVNEPGDQQKKN
jgi:hypothetical protein